MTIKPDGLSNMKFYQIQIPPARLIVKWKKEPFVTCAQAARIHYLC